ncbi:MAG: bifunctional (p)ppGpp synthetase/guanosine-3',5'-bis(diphosphate) 3'-pyrophosphohydrolase [Bauldia sp.]|uniref:RelA/SpoT family protein n=1 Tax=Bauldia sp. TaxID=2575872 RepID=UPI001D8D3989|nr:bifunctional (p)ppGpp synthetase/guanosine-3',5'-bis(diphosphate) 3'-pyrophosphohydrolase [Bauldia sp.]MCB1496830.1 bifunctional (p)ppGpp synthetase/guanosine-3',5'-bis(diphosphate) 3'-pyrophosphohydrolase [Bauldia sp.]
MMRQYELVERVTRYNPNADENLLNKAYVYAMQKHGTQQRANGDPYFSHPLEVAAILTDLKLDDATIAAALLHDTIEDTDATRAEIDSTFGEDIGQLVEGLTKIQKLDLVSRKAAQAENIRKLLLAISEDVRVLLVKLADRLHNMRTLQFMPEASRRRIAEETLEIYAPLAGRMGMHDMREELEELAFRVVNPEAYATISGRLEELRRRNSTLIASIEKELTEGFVRHGISAEVHGREKRPYSIFRKMERKAVSFEQLSDIIGFRVIVGSVPECYAALGVVHSTWPAVPGRFKDYISTPKQNDYRSIHSTVIGPGRQRVELQIRTRGMEQVAEYGIAAHALYKDEVPVRTKGNGANGVNGARPTNGASGGKSGFDAEIRAYQWLRHTIEMLAEGDTPEEFLEHTKLELFQDQVFCFTPKGRLIALPRGATPIDFAYAVHTDIGDTCVGAKINGRAMPLMTELHNGDEVEIVCSKAQVPPAAWESMVVTGKARSAIRRATRAAVRRQYAGLGRRILERGFERAKRAYSDEMIKAILPRLAQSNLEDALAAVGRGEIPLVDVLKAAYPDHKEERQPRGRAKNEEGWFGLPRAAGLKFRVPGFPRKAGVNRKANVKDDRPIPIRGLAGDMPVHFAEGGALPGERIVGITSPGEGVTIYPITSQALKDFDDEPDRWLDVRWEMDQDVAERFPARIEVTAMNEPGTLAQIAQVIADNDGNISNLRITKNAPDFSVMLIDLEVFDLKHLSRVVAQLRARPVVSSANRVNA